MLNKVWFSLVCVLCFGVSQGEACFGYELIENKLDKLDKKLTDLIESLSMKQSECNAKISALTSNVAANKLRLSDLNASSAKIQTAIDEGTNSIATKINNQNTRLEKLETMDKAISKALEQHQNQFEAKYLRLVGHLNILEASGDAVLSKQKSTDSRISEITASISTLDSQSKQILKNHFDLVIPSCSMAKVTGLYRLQTPNMNVVCEATVDGGGWLIIQRRFNGELDFNKNSYDYKVGFGTVGLRSEYWLGLEVIHQITNSDGYELRIDIRKEGSDEFKYAQYSQFKVAPESDGYRLTVGGHSGTAIDGLSPHNNMRFSTYEWDNDSNTTRNCAKEYRSGWWFKNCRYSNLNGPYKKASNGYGIEWGSWADAATSSRMMIRRKK